MSILYKTIADLCQAKGVTGYRMCRDIKIQPSNLTDLKMGRIKNLSAVNLSKVANYFGVSVEYLLGNEPKENIPDELKLTPNQRALVEFAKSVPDDKAEMILRVMQSILESR